MKSNEFKNFGSYLKHCRSNASNTVRAGKPMSQWDLCQLIHKKDGYVQRLENGIKLPHEDELTILSRHVPLNIDIAKELLENDKVKKKVYGQKQKSLLISFESLQGEQQSKVLDFIKSLEKNT
ncbi:MAG: hypothetical protein ACK4NC_02105 [Candidatus Gracilibacteria bacterium]